MKPYLDILNKILEKSHDGMDIIVGELPQAEVCIHNVKAQFKIRDERTASAGVYPPNQRRNYWVVRDFGGPEGERYFTPITLVMWRRGLEFWPALQTLAVEYGVDCRLSSTTNKPLLTRRPAVAGEQEGQETLTLLEGYSAEGLAAWGHGTKADVLEKLGWAEVQQVVKTKDGMTIVKEHTEGYPIFRQRCYYVDSQGNRMWFDKVYEPHNYQKQYRFHSIGMKPQGYIFGLDAVIEEYQRNGSQKLDSVFLVSGGSDAVACWSRGQPAIWMGSERDRFDAVAYKKVMTYCKVLYNVPDTDSTGIDEGRKKALAFPEIKTVWLNDEDMYHLPDNRGNRRKDLKDYLDLHREPNAISQLRNRAVKACFWDYKTSSNGDTTLVLSPRRLNYYLWLQGFCTLKDDSNDKPRYLHFDGIKVQHVVAKSIRSFLLEHAAQQGWPEALQDKLMRTNDLPTDKRSSLPQLPEVNTIKATSDSQPLFFKNCWVVVTKDKVERHSYSELSEQCVWADRIIPHDFKPQPQMFSITKNDNDTYQVDISADAKSRLLKYYIGTSRLHWRKELEGGNDLSAEEQADQALCLVSRIANAGYLMHQYKSLSAAYATVCIDYKLGRDKSEKNGGSGKTLYGTTLGHMVNSIYREGKRRQDVESKYFFGGTTEANGLFFIDECHDALDLGQFFGRVTGSFLVEQKNEPIYTIPFEQSPKLLFATNGVIRQHDPATERRLWYQVFSDYYHVQTSENDYSETRTVRDDVGCNLMDGEYSENDWQQDIAFLIQCLQYHLSLPQDEWKVNPPMAQVRRREQQASISKPLTEWANEFFSTESGNLNTTLVYNDVYSDFVSDTKSQMSKRTFTESLKTYCRFSGLTYNPASITGKQEDGAKWQTYHNGNDKLVVCIYIQSSESQQADAAVESSDAAIDKAIEQGLPF